MKRKREDGLPKPRALTPTVRRLIVHRATTQRHIPRDYLANDLIREIKEAGEIPPTLETIKRYISKAKNSYNPLDQPWTLACCSEYYAFFPPESIPIIIHYKDHLAQLQSNSEYDYDQFFDFPISTISIRCAIWIIRLRPIIKYLSPKLWLDGDPPPPDLDLAIAITYSMAEKASELLGEDHFDSCDLDNALFSGDIRLFALLTAKMFWATAKPCDNNHNCDSCDYVKLPGLKGICIPKRKERLK